MMSLSINGTELSVDADLLRRQARAVEKCLTAEGLETLNDGDWELFEGVWEFLQRILDEA